MLAIDVCKKLYERDGKALSRSFGNFDQRVAIGWLLADAAGYSLLTSSPGTRRTHMASSRSATCKYISKITTKNTGTRISSVSTHTRSWAINFSVEH